MQKYGKTTKSSQEACKVLGLGKLELSDEIFFSLIESHFFKYNKFKFM